ncbi:hypothetical protein NGB36_01315 [Streptomyces sp. RB6PN25]|uniref:Intracellular septation protein A n=1 Tax=Streptomyces humicola TaxID=2953240 RepID=A0ABT1PQ83_9ACTN|nr:VC0807 family protein [Streptomyces humicola]MCQ4079283.1 hypothetical protein [Streptomyces humicola]
MPQTSSDPATPTETRSRGRRLNPASRAMVTTLFYDIGLSVNAYFVAELLGASNYLALLVGTVVSGLRMLWVAVRQRRLDPFALFLLALFGAGLALSFVTGDPRFILAKDSTMSCAAGLVLVGSCIIRRPLAYYAAQRFARSAGNAQHEEFQSTAKTTAMRARWFRASLVWGISLLVDAGLRIAAIYLLPIGLAANVSQILMIAVYGLLILWTIHSAKKAQAAPQTMVEL